MRLDAGLVVGGVRDRFETTLDLDGDGFMDAFDWWYTDNGYDEIFLSGWINDGTGVLVERWTINVDVGDNFGDIERAAAGDLPNTPWLGTTSYNWPWIGFYYLFSSPGDGLTNSGELEIGFTVDPATVGFGGLYLQSYWADAGHPFGISSTAGLFFECE